jgi:hypothetical protein
VGFVVDVGAMVEIGEEVGVDIGVTVGDESANFRMQLPSLLLT